jgi:hypothetical protein
MRIFSIAMAKNFLNITMLARELPLHSSLYR